MKVIAYNPIENQRISDCGRSSILRLSKARLFIQDVERQLEHLGEGDALLVFLHEVTELERQFAEKVFGYFFSWETKGAPKPVRGCHIVLVDPNKYCQRTLDMVLRPHESAITTLCIKNDPLEEVGLRKIQPLRVYGTKALRYVYLGFFPEKLQEILDSIMKAKLAVTVGDIALAFNRPENQISPYVYKLFECGALNRAKTQGEGRYMGRPSYMYTSFNPIKLVESEPLKKYLFPPVG